MSINEVIEKNAINRAKQVAKIFNVKNFKINVEVFNIKEGEFKVTFDSTSSGANMAKSNVINAAVFAGIEEECRRNNVTCDFSINVTVANNN